MERLGAPEIVAAIDSFGASPNAAGSESPRGESDSTSAFLICLFVGYFIYLFHFCLGFFEMIIIVIAVI